MHRRSLLALAGSSLAFLTLGFTTVRADEYRVSGPVIHENLAIYLVHGKSAAGPVPLTLDEALGKRAVKVHETGNVNELQIENLGTDEVFVQSGDIVKGGQQDRVLTVSLILPPKSGRIPIASFCVEQGRWTARGKEDVKTFATASAVVPSREAKIAMKAPVPAARRTDADRRLAPRRRRTMAYAGSDTGSRQQQVWAKVRKVQDGLSSNLGTTVNAATSQTSLQLALENEKLKDAQAAYLAALKPAGEKERRDRLRLRRQRQAQQRRGLSVERPVPQNVAEAVAGERHRGDRPEERRRRADAVERSRAGVPRCGREGSGEREAAARAGAARNARRREGVLFRDAARERRLGASQLPGEITLRQPTAGRAPAVGSFQTIVSHAVRREPVLAFRATGETGEGDMNISIPVVACSAASPQAHS